MELVLEKGRPKTINLKCKASIVESVLCILTFDTDALCLLVLLLRRHFELQAEQPVSVYDWFNWWESSSANCLAMSAKYAVRKVSLFYGYVNSVCCKVFDCFFHK
jgi:hypothetical protein